MSISSQAFHSSQWSASREPALPAKPFISSNRAARHHEHQLPSPSRHPTRQASIMSISSQAFHSSQWSASREPALPAKPFIASNRAARHHEHQLPSASWDPTRQASIMSISSQAFHSSQWSASRAPALKPFIPARQPSLSLQPAGRPGIMSISSQALRGIQPDKPASWASAPKPFIPVRGQHRENQLCQPSLSLHPTGRPGIMSISSQALRGIQPDRPAS